MTWQTNPWAGVFAATLCAFREDQSIDETGLAEYVERLVAVAGIQGVVCNGHTGEVMSLLPRERMQVTRIVAESVARSTRRVKVTSGVMAEGTVEAIEHAQAAKEAGADSILLMPPHHWLRFGRTSPTAVAFCTEVADAAGIDIVLHQYPAWTKASYLLPEMIEIARHPRVVMIKMGTRDMSRWLYDYEQLKQSSPETTIVTCHDEFLLPTLLEAADGALIGFAGFAPRLIVELVHAALDGDYARAKRAQKTVAPLARLIYNFGEPGCGAHQRMKVARWLLGHFPSPHFRRPIQPLAGKEINAIRDALEMIGPTLTDAF
ncbi:MAG: dihydrodipicolinate synthase family protein [Planctomycetales bacterium]|nr:dihydrodipicolinate synthase family protein [Planctomycetales bacterium]